MIELNLLPKELRTKKKRQTVQQGPRMPIFHLAACIMAVLVTVNLLISLLVMNNKGLLKTLNGKWDQMEPQREKTSKVASEIASLQKKVTAVRKIAKPDLAWTKLLSGLNQAVIPNVWLSEFILKFREEGGRRGAPKTVSELPETLDITGYALGSSESATALVGKFITSLKRNTDFSEYFDGIELKNMRGSEIADEEVMMFELECKFKAEEVAPTQTKRSGLLRRRR